MTIPAGWCDVALKEVVTEVQYGLSISMESSGRFPILRMAAIQDGKVMLDDLKYVDLTDDVARRYVLRRNDVLLNRTNSGDLVGKVGIFGGELDSLVFASYLMRLIVDPKADSRFIGHLLTSYPSQCRLRRYATPGVQQANINASNVRKVVVAMPWGYDGAKNEQGAIAAILDAADAALQRNREVLRTTERLKRGLMQRLLPQWIGFKRVADGELPDGTESHLAASVCRIKNGTTPSRTEYTYWSKGTIPWLATGKVNERIIRHADEFVTPKALEECSIELLPSGTVLVGMIGQGKTRGMAAYLEMSACINQNFGAFVPGKRVIGRFLYHYLTFHYERLRELGGGTNQGALNCYMLKRIRLPLPKPERQTDIAKVLDACDAVAEQHERRIDVLRRLKRALMQDLLTGKVRVPVGIKVAHP